MRITWGTEGKRGTSVGACLAGQRKLWNVVHHVFHVFPPVLVPPKMSLDMHKMQQIGKKCKNLTLPFVRADSLVFISYQTVVMGFVFQRNSLILCLFVCSEGLQLIINEETALRLEVLWGYSTYACRGGRPQSIEAVLLINMKRVTSSYRGTKLTHQPQHCLWERIQGCCGDGRARCWEQHRVG